MLSFSDITPAQDRTIDRLVEHDQTLLVAPKGVGKCVIGQTALQELLDSGDITRALVVAPLKVCQLTWATEYEKWEHLKPPAVAAGYSANIREAVINSAQPIVVLNFDTLAWLFETFGSDHGFDALLVDESTKLKAAGGTGFKALRKHLKDFKWRAAMTADPVAEMGTDLYTQALMVDGGAALGRNQDNFRRSYFYPTDFEQRRWKLLPGMETPLRLALQDVLYVVEDSGYEASLPALLEDTITVALPAGARRLYDRIAADGVVELGGVEIEAPSAAVVATKQRQICSGALYDADRAAHFVHNAKVEAAERFIMAQQAPLIVVYFYRFELDWLKMRFPDVVVLAEGPREAEVAWNAGEVSLLALHPDSAGHGLNLQAGGHEMLVMTAPWGADPWEQIVGRIRRRGQPSPFVRRTTIVVDDTVDAECMARHLDKRADSDNLNAGLAAEGG